MAVVTHLRALQALELAIRKGSMKDAAASLSISPAALGQRVRALEDYLGYDLLVRGRSGIRPTRELDGALAHLKAGFRELETVAEILDFQRESEIHLSADSDWADLWLKPRIHAFREENPSTLICINGVGDAPTRPGQVECAIWFGPEDPKIEGLPLFRDYLVPVSSPINNVRISALPRETRLEGFPLLHLDCYAEDGGAIGWPDWVGRYGYRKTSPELGIRYRKVQHALEAVYANAGLMLCGLALIQPMVADGRLQIPFPIAEGEWSNHAYRVRFAPRVEERESCRRFRSWLIEQAEATERGLHSQVRG